MSSASITAHSSPPLTGEVRLPADRLAVLVALILAAVTVGRSRIREVLPGRDLDCLVAALRALGPVLGDAGENVWSVDGVGIGGLAEPGRSLDFIGAAQPLTLLMGLLATHPVTATFTAETGADRGSLMPLMRPLKRMGAQFLAARGGCLPLTLAGAELALAASHTVPAGGGDLKAALLLAGLNALGQSVVVEPAGAPDPFAGLFCRFGASVVAGPAVDGLRRTTIDGQPELTPADLIPPVDRMAALAALTAALTVPGSMVIFAREDRDCLGPDLLTCLSDMGAAMDDGGVRAGPLRRILVPEGSAAALFDDYPMLAVVAAQAEGPSLLSMPPSAGAAGATWLSAMAEGLSRCGIAAAFDGRQLAIEGTGGPVPGGARFEGPIDQRLAAAWLVLGLGARQPVTLVDGRAIHLALVGCLRGLGAVISEEHV